LPATETNRTSGGDPDAAPFVASGDVVGVVTTSQVRQHGQRPTREVPSRVGAVKTQRHVEHSRVATEEEDVEGAK